MQCDIGLIWQLWEPKEAHYTFFNKPHRCPTLVNGFPMFCLVTTISKICIRILPCLVYQMLNWNHLRVLWCVGFVVLHSVSILIRWIWQKNEQEESVVSVLDVWRKHNMEATAKWAGLHASRNFFVVDAAFWLGECTLDPSERGHSCCKRLRFRRQDIIPHLKSKKICGILGYISQIKVRVNLWIFRVCKEL